MGIFKSQYDSERSARGVIGRLGEALGSSVGASVLSPAALLLSVPWALNAAFSGDVGRDEAEALVERYLGELSDSELESILDHYYVEDNKWYNAWGFGGYDRRVLNDEERLERHLKELLEATEFTGTRPDKETYLDDARKAAGELYGGMYNELNAQAAEREAMYKDELANLAGNYRAARTGLLSQQQMQNAQLMDTLQSGMERSRRNALEAGASAGVRIADNINTLLSVQNKQSATSMETANQLSQMMINQRNAEADANRSYFNDKSQNTAYKQSLMREEESYASNLANTNYNAAMDKYTAKQDEYDRQTDNPLLGRRYDKGLYGGN